MPKNFHLHLKGTVGYWNFSTDQVSYVLDKHPGEEVNVLIDSRGGDVASALSISSLFKNHGNVHCHYMGMNASAATFASMGAKRVTMDANALYLIHKCSNFVLEWDYMNADELERHIQELQNMKDDQEKINSVMVAMYCRKCAPKGKTKEDIMELISRNDGRGVWLTAKDALEWGFVDEITDDDDTEPIKLTSAMVASLTEEGIPMPPSQYVKKGTVLDRFFQFLSSPFTHDTQRDEQPASDDNSNSSPSTTMAKTFAKIAALLGCAMAFADEKYSLTDEQAQKLEDGIAERDARIDELTSSIAEKDKTITDLNEKVTDLKQKPADDTLDVQHNAAGGDAEDEDKKPFESRNKNIDYLLGRIGR